ncbi:MAG TPA: NifB/NifX family molybdenum-iron cluster-binding protein [Geobacteraceae bacterium]|nr:NifB/NifX family molybdenum-iron cluster-binding protein [Geobacteraceae bacterium]
MTKAAFAYWNDRIAPVFDNARQIRIVEADNGCVVTELEDVLSEASLVHRATRLAQIDIDTLVCGAISRPLHEAIAAYGIRVISFVAGDLHEIIRAWMNGSLEGGDYAMPGCCGTGRHRRERIFDGKREGIFMNGKQGGGRGQGQGGRGQGRGGRGQGRGGQGQGRMSGPRAGGAVGICRCPHCGHREPHERGVPCLQKQCPKCGTALVRE